jgi:hypothetical protein
MKPHRSQTRQYFLLIILTALVTLVPLSSPLVPPAVAAETPSTAELLAQTGDLDSPASSAEPQTTSATASTTDSDAFDTEKLEQLVAPIALYPDALLMQILMASTYPLEIVEADRWIRDKPDLTGDALDKALLEKNWDPSVKSLTTLPSVLKQMSENLDWTQDLGDAFLAQENDLLDTVQRMRGLAYDAGNLETTEQQKVTQQPDKIIVIESSSPEIIYVPTYSPTVVYGPAWGYPYWYYPRWYYPPAPGYGFVAFTAGVVVGAAIWGGCRWGWGHNSVNININRHNEFNRNTNINADRNRINSGGRDGTAGWQHDSSHRKGVNYSSSNVAQKYGASSGSNRVTSNQARGYSGASASNRAATGAQAGNRSGASSRPSASTANRGPGSSSAARSPSTANRSSGSSSAARSPSTANRSTGSSSAFSGSRSPSTDRMSSSRGASSRGATSYGGSRGGASRGGGRRR